MTDDELRSELAALRDAIKQLTIVVHTMRAELATYVEENNLE